MKTAIIFLAFLTTVFCLPMKRSASSSESSEEVRVPSRFQNSQVKPRVLQYKEALTDVPTLDQAEPKLTVVTSSDESNSDETEEDNTTSDSDTDENDTSSESTESITTTATPLPEETSFPPIINGRGDSLGFPEDYKKSIIYGDSNKIENGPSPYKYYGTNKVDDDINLVSKKSSLYDEDGNDVEKSLKVYKAVQVHEHPLDEDTEDTSTPEVEGQGLDSSSGTEEEPSSRQGPAGIEGVEEAEPTSASASDSISATEGSDSSQSSEETTATPGAADNDSSQSSESQESDSAENTTQEPMVITAK